MAVLIVLGAGEAPTIELAGVALPVFLISGVAETLGPDSLVTWISCRNGCDWPSAEPANTIAKTAIQGQTADFSIKNFMLSLLSGLVVNQVWEGRSGIHKYTTNRTRSFNPLLNYAVVPYGVNSRSFDESSRILDAGHFNLSLWLSSRMLIRKFDRSRNDFLHTRVNMPL